MARASTRDKIIALVTTLAVSLLAIKLLVKDHDVLFLLAEFVHFIVPNLGLRLEGVVQDAATNNEEDVPQSIDHWTGRFVAG